MAAVARGRLDVPVVDLAASAASSAAALDDACRRVGFFQVVRHGADADVLAAVLDTSRRFFAQPTATKMRCAPPDPAVNRGYAGRGSEGLAYSVGVTRPPDLFEAFNVGPDDPDLRVAAIAAERHRHFAANIWPDQPSDFRDAVVAWFAEARKVADRVVALFAPALGMPDDWFGTFTTHSTDTLRINHYETQPGDPDPLQHQLGMGEHSDYGICTVLYGEACTDGSAGLQIVAPDGEWRDVVPQPGALLVNLGDLTAQWTNDRWRSTLHRVLVPPRHAISTNRRQSIAFFHDGNHDALIECLPVCTHLGNPPRYTPVLAGDHLMAKVMGPRTLQPSAAQQTTGERLT